MREIRLEMFMYDVHAEYRMDSYTFMNVGKISQVVLSHICHKVSQIFWYIEFIQAIILKSIQKLKTKASKIISMRSDDWNFWATQTYNFKNIWYLNPNSESKCFICIIPSQLARLCLINMYRNRENIFMQIMNINNIIEGKYIGWGAFCKSSF